MVQLTDSARRREQLGEVQKLELMAEFRGGQSIQTSARSWLPAVDDEPRNPMFSLIIAILAIALIVAVVVVSGYFGGDAISDAQAKAQAAQLVNEQSQIFTAMDGFQADNRRWPTDIQELVSAGYLRSIPAGAQVQTTAAAARFDLISSAHAADPLALGWSMPAARVPIIFTVKVPKTTCQAYNQASRGDNGILRQAFESLAAQCYGADGNYNVVAKKAVAGVNLAGTLPTSVEPGNLPAKEMDGWWDSAPSGAVQVPTDPDKTPKAELALTGAGLNFGQVQLGQAVTSPAITLRNGGKVVAQGVNISAPAGFDLVDNTCEAAARRRRQLQLRHRFRTGGRGELCWRGDGQRQQRRLGTTERHRRRCGGLRKLHRSELRRRACGPAGARRCSPHQHW